MRRRALLGAAVLLAGCGEESGPAPRGEEVRGGDSSLADAALLNDAIAAEFRTTGTLPAAPAHVARLERMVEGVGGEVREIPDRVVGPESAEVGAAGLVAFYVDLLPKLGEPRLREEVGALLRDAATALARARADAGHAAATTAFEAGEAPS